MRYCRQRAQQPFRIDRTLHVEMSLGQKRAVYYGIDIGQIIDISVEKEQQCAISGKQTAGDPYHAPAGHIQGKHRHDTVAQRYARKHSCKSEPAEIEDSAPRTNIVEPVQRPADEQNQHCPPKNLLKLGQRRSERRLRQRQISRHAHYEEKKGKNEVTRRQTVPFAVLQRVIAVRSTSVVDYYHSGYGYATHHIQCGKTRIRCFDFHCTS